MTENNRTEGRRTALIVGATLLTLAGLSAYRGRHAAPVLLASAGIVLIVTGLALPGWAARFHAAWVRFAALLGYVNSRIVLGAFFFTIITTFGSARRLLGCDPLNRRCRRRGTYWVPRTSTRATKEQFEHLF